MIGEILRNAREEKKLSIMEISSATRISKKYIQALEDENFLLIPSQVYASGFLKTYSNYLGLDTRSLLSELSSYYSRKEESRRSVPLKMRQSKKAPENRNAIVIGSVILAFLLLFIFAFSLYRWMHRAGPVIAESLKEAVVEEKKPEVKKPITYKKPIVVTQEAADLTAGKVEVKLETVGRSWVQVMSGNKELYNETLEPGVRLNFIGREIKVRAGNGGGVKVSVNGKPAGVMGEDGVVVERTFRAGQ